MGIAPAPGGTQFPRQCRAQRTDTAVIAAPTLVEENIAHCWLRSASASIVCNDSATLRRHTLRLLLRQQRRCGVTFSDCCCGSRDVAASHSQTAVAAAETLRRHPRRLLLRQQERCGIRNLHLDKGGTGATPQAKPVSRRSPTPASCAGSCCEQ